MSETVFKVTGTVGIDANLLYGDVEVTKGEDLKVNVGAFSYDIGGKRGSYAGSIGNAITASDESYIYVDTSGVLQINVTGFPSVAHLRLARVVADADRATIIYDERPVLAASSSSEGLCRIGYPVDGGVRGGGTTASTNNDMAAVRFAYSEDGWNRWNARPPQNYLSGDLLLRLYVTVPTSPADDTATKWTLEYAFRSLGEDLGSYDTPVGLLHEFDGSLIADDLFALDFTIPSGDFDKDADLMFFKVERLATDAEDDCGKYVYVHVQELRYTGLLLAGQAGQ